MSYIDLIFSTNQSVISIHGVDVLMINVITILFRVKLTYVYLCLQHIYERSEIIKKQILKILRKQYQTLIGIKLCLSVDVKVEFLNKTLLIIFRNYIPNKKIKCNYRQPLWMTDSIKKSLKRKM